MTRQILVPDLGDFANVDVIDVLVEEGDVIERETPILTLETDKATMDVPSDAAGRITALKVRKGDKVSKGDVIAELEEVSEPASGQADQGRIDSEPGTRKEEESGPRVRDPAQGPAANRQQPGAGYDFDLIVLGAGPGGYTAAFRAADLGMKVGLIERWPMLGGVCLNVGCIPSKALLHAGRVLEEAEAMAAHGIEFGKPKIDSRRLRDWKNSIVSRLVKGLAALARQRKIEVIHGYGRFADSHAIEVSTDEHATGRGRRITFAQCIIAAGSESARLPGLVEDPRIIDSTGALELDLPARMLVVGGGIIGLEMACVYDALGVRVSVVELLDGLMPGADRDLIKPLEKRIARRYEKIMLGTRVAGVEPVADGLRVSFEGKQAIAPEVYDKVLVAVGRTPNGGRIAAGAAGVTVTDRGYIPVDRHMRTNVPHIFAIGDVVGQPMLAHKATHEGKVAAEVAHGKRRAFDARVIPSVAYTDPEIAWVGLTETEARARGIDFGKGQFPWAASGRSLAIGRDEGFTKILFARDSHRVLGGGIVGTNAGELIGEVALAVEMGCDAADIGLTVHPHPTLSETLAMAAEAFEGTLTDLYVPRKK